MPERWVLARAGITNVYQYDDEVLSFAGGRLLLRGVNGSGKSTAMNMLLPFLLEADTRRIDAAGEQSRVLRSWMLSGRDEQQPVGYLWIELRRGTERLVCGCGIRANQSTDRVTTWWFVTDRRPGVDLVLVEGRVPLSVDALRAELGGHAVFSHEQRAGYRREVRARLYGGADIDQHVRLLHVVRNPRVGDRIDVDLPQYLQDALPELSEAAVDDAAQPLEDLEEHRRNVEDLTRTVDALGSLAALYGMYGRVELRRRAAEGQERAASVAQLQRAERSARREEGAATDELGRAQQAVADLERDELRLRAEIDAAEASDLYAEGGALNDLRAHVVSLAQQLRDGAARLDRDGRRVAEARSATERAAQEAGEDRDRLALALAELEEGRAEAGVAGASPVAPVLQTAGSEADDELRVPEGRLDLDGFRAGLTTLRAAAQHRTGDIGEVRQALDRADRAEAALRQAEDQERAARQEEEASVTALGQARKALADAAAAWRDDLMRWVARLEEHRAGHGLPPLEAPDLGRADLAGSSHEVVDHLLRLVDGTATHHREARATLGARRVAEQEAVTEAAAHLAELAARSVPELPILGWQEPLAGPALADLVDFAPTLGPDGRANLEAAMEASGLLSAELRADGTVVVGQLVVGPGAPVPEPLGALLVVTVPVAASVYPPVDPAAVAAVLAGISTRESDLAGESDADNSDERGVVTAVVTTGGGFRVGPLRGRHRKLVAEHVGSTARREALERQRAEARAVLAAAGDVLAATDHAIARADVAMADIAAIRRTIPPARLVIQGIAEVRAADEGLVRARERREARAAGRGEADRVHGEAVDAGRRLAATNGLPADRVGLGRVEDALRRATTQLEVVASAARSLARTVEAWAGRGSELLVAAADRAGSERGHARLRDEHEPLAMKLATLEDSVGLPYQELQASLDVSRRDLGAAAGALTAARSAHLQAVKHVTSAERDRLEATRRREAAEARCVALLPDLRRALAVPGLLAAAVRLEDAAPSDPAAPDPVLPAVEETPDGVRLLVDAVLGTVPEPDATGGSADSVRQSLRRRRDTLGAGWDAEDRQPDPAVPLQIEVTGPLGRMPLERAATVARSQLHRSASLLSAKQDQALRNLLQGLVAKEVAEKLHAARELVELMNRRLDTVRTSHGIGVSLRWRRRDDVGRDLTTMIDLLSKPPDLRTVAQDEALAAALSQRIADGRAADADATFRDLIGTVLDYRSWHRATLVLHRPGQPDEQLSRRTALSEGEKKMVSYLALFAAVAASCDAMAVAEPAAPRFVLLDDAFSKVSEDNHAKLFGLLVELDLDFVATSERLWGTHATVPELAITEVIRDATLGVIVLEHSRWDGARLTAAT